MITLTEKQEGAIEILSNRNSIKKWIADCNIDRFDLTSFAERLTIIANKMNEEAEALAEERKAKQEKVKQFLSILEENGLSVEDLNIVPTGRGVAKEGDKRRNRQDPVYKIQYVDLNGKRITVERKLVGRLPPDIKAYLADTGKTIKDLIVGEKPEEVEVDTPTTEVETVAEAEPKKSKKK